MMVHVWILIMFFGATGSYGKSVDHIYFESKDECVTAQKEIQEQAGGGVYYACVEGVK